MNSKFSFDSSDKNQIAQVHKPLIDRIAGRLPNKKHFVLSGGRVSFKSYSTCLAIVISILSHASKGEVISSVCFMHNGQDIRGGPHKLFEMVLDDFDSKIKGFKDSWKIKYSPFEITYENGSKVYFHALNRQDGKKGIATPNLAIAWFEEADQFESSEAIKKARQSLGRYAIDEGITWIYSFNPPKSNHHWIFEFLKTFNDENTLKIHSTYKDAEHLVAKDLMEEILDTKERDPNWYTYSYLGEVTDDQASDFPSLIQPKDELKLTAHDFIFVGIDSATKGKDSTCACALSYNTELRKIKFLGFEKFDDDWIDGYSSIAIGSQIADFCRKINANAVYVDPKQGQHIIDYLKINAEEIDTRSVDFGSKVSETASGKVLLALNKRAEMYLNASEWLKRKAIINYADARRLMRQLEATEFIVDTKKIQVIKKDLIKERVGHSPDEADSFVLAVQAVVDHINQLEEVTMN